MIDSGTEAQYRDFGFIDLLSYKGLHYARKTTYATKEKIAKPHFLYHDLFTKLLKVKSLREYEPPSALPTTRNTPMNIVFHTDHSQTQRSKIAKSKPIIVKMPESKSANDTIKYITKKFKYKPLPIINGSYAIKEEYAFSIMSYNNRNNRTLESNIQQ